jgi:transcriptional regulator with XRE-family HTH domain
MYKSTIKKAISKWNSDNPTLRKKTMGYIASELGISNSYLSQIDNSEIFQKHACVILEPKVKLEQVALFELYRKLDIPIINKLQKIREILNCEIYDLIEEDSN